MWHKLQADAKPADAIGIKAKVPIQKFVSWWDEQFDAGDTYSMSAASISLFFSTILILRDLYKYWTNRCRERRTASWIRRHGRISAQENITLTAAGEQPAARAARRAFARQFQSFRAASVRQPTPPVVRPPQPAAL